MMKLKLALSMFVFACSLMVFSAEFDGGDKILVVGNPGVGKSLILNTLLQEEAFKSGLSFDGSGVTKTMQMRRNNNVTFIDTPGLDEEDFAEKQRIAREIEGALKLGGNYRIFFVITLEAGRIKPMDKVTINTVMNSISLKNKEYNIIVNKCEKKVVDRHARHEDDLLLLQLNAGMKYKFSSIFYVPYQGEDPCFLTKDPAFEQWVYRQSRFLQIKPSDVQPIVLNDESLERELKEFETLSAKLKSLTAEQAKEYRRLLDENRLNYQQKVDALRQHNLNAANVRRTELSNMQAKLEEVIVPPEFIILDYIEAAQRTFNVLQQVDLSKLEVSPEQALAVMLATACVIYENVADLSSESSSED